MDAERSWFVPRRVLRDRLVKGVLTDQSRVEFDGMIRVRPKAQQTASFLSAHGLLLSKQARGEFKG